ncbi:MAG: YdbH domain-containing protein [Nitrospinota bacterium]
MPVDEGKAKMAGRKRKRVLWFSAGLALILMVFGAIAFKMILPRLIERYILAELRSAGIERADLDVRLIDWNHAVFTNLRVGEEGDLRIAEVTAQYSLPDLLQGRLKRITVSGLRMHIHVDANGASFGTLDNLLRSTQDGGTVPLVFPAAVIEIRTSQLDVTTPFGASTVTVSAKLRLANSGAIQVAAELGFWSSNASLSTEAVLRVEPDGRLEGSVQISRATLALAALDAGTISGELTFKSFGYEMERLQGRISFGELKLPLASFRKTGLEFELVGNRLTAKGVMISSDDQAKIEFVGKVDDIFASAPSITLRGEVEARAASVRQQALSLPHSVKGHGRVGIILKGTLPDLRRLTVLRGGFGKLDAVALNGTVDLNLSDASLPRSFTGLSVAGHLKVELSGNLLTIGSAKGIHLKAERLDPVFLTRWAEAAEFRRNLKGPLSLWIGGGTRTPFILQARVGRNSVAVRMSGRTLLTVVNGLRLKSEVNATAELFSDGKLKRFDIPYLGIVLTNWRQATGTVVVKVRDVRLAGTPERFSGRFSAELSADDVRFSRLAIQEAYLVFGGDLVFRKKRMIVRPQRGGLVRVAGVQWEESAITFGPLNLLINPVNGSRFEVDFGKADGPVLRYLVTLVPSPVKVDVLLPRDQRLSMLAKVPRVRLDGEVLWSRGDYQAAVVATRGSLEVPSHAIALRGVDVKLRLNPSSPGERVSASLNVSRILHLEDPPYVRPLRLKAEIKRHEDRLLFSGQINELSGKLALDFDGAQDLAGGGGNVNLRLHQLRFTPKVDQPQDLFPALRDSIAWASGKVALEGKITWAGQKLTSKVKLLIEELSLRTDQLVLNRVNSKVRFDSLRPLSTPPGQLVAIAMIDVGFPLTHGVISFHIEPEGRLVIERTEWRLAGGKIRAEGVSIDPRSAQHKFVLEIEGVNLQKLVALAKVEGLTVIGRLTGDIAVLIKEGALIIREGLLEATPEGGTVRYDPSEVPSALRHGGEKTQLMLSALENFQYKTLRIKLNRRSDGNTKVSLHLRGSNPDFFKGRPVELNLNLSGQLDQMLQRGLKGYKIPETIIRQFQKFGR